MPYPRYMAPRLREALGDTPAVLIHGPRQSGKTTLARTVGEPRGYRYLSFDDDAILAAARSDPIGFVAGLPSKTILDEVQRIPEIFTSLTTAIDARRTPGRFILTGSANVLLVPRLAESLAGRMGILRLHPLAQSEIEGKRSRFLDRIFSAGFRSGVGERLGVGLAERIVAGGYPAAITRRAPKRRRAWYRDYVGTQIQRDVRDIARIRSLDALPKLLSLAASHAAQLINVADLAAQFELTRQTIHEYVTVLERVFLLERLPAWHNNRLSRLVKRPKLHMGDTGVACALLRIDALALHDDRTRLGSMLETFVLQELRRQSSWRPTPVEFFHFRDRDDFEVDIVVEQGHAAVVGIDVKAAATVTDGDFRGLRKLREAAGTRFAAGVVLYDGSATVRHGDRMFSVPLRALWETV
ncbi:MAG: ATP-binding protein [Gemmatimonadaceae bacterium]|nr:ATP-binding protein [Gemmatimonadaceae bacterium]